MLHRVLKMAFWVCFDHLGKLLVANVLSFALVLVPLLAAWWLAGHSNPVTAVVVAGSAAGLSFVVALPVCMAALAAMMKELIETRDGSLRTFVTGLRRFAPRAVGLGGVFMAAEALFATSVWFYSSRFGGAMPVLGFGLSALALWAMFFTGLMALFAAPALVQKNGGIFATLRLSALLVLDNPLLTVGMVVALLPLLLACMAPPVIMLFSIAPMMAVVSSAYEMLSRKYAAVEAHKARGLAGAPRVDYGDENDDYLNRGFRDFLFPWKG